MSVEERQRRLRERLAADGVPALLVTNLVNVRYLTGFTGSFGELLITTDASADVLATDGRYAEQAAAQVSGVQVAVLPGPEWLVAAFGEAALGVEAEAIPWSRVLELRDRLGELIPTTALVEELRLRKDAGEIEALRTACAVADDAFTEMLGWLAPGLSEREVAVRLERAMVDGGAKGPAFDTIVAAGVNAARPHHRPTQTVLAAGDMVKFDFGALVDGYHSDMTRMVSLGAPGPQLREVFDVVHAAQASGLTAVRDGVSTDAVDAACRRVVTAAGYGERFVHGTGHGVGLQIHEDPYLRPTDAGAAAPGPSVTLRDRMTVTVEPGIYLPGVGGVRIEDSLVVTPDGADVLTTTPKELVIL